HAELLQLQRAALDARYGVDMVEAKTLGEHVAEVERDAPRQRLQVHERDQLAQAGIDLEELAVLGVELEIAGETRVVDRGRLAEPAEALGGDAAARKPARLGGGGRLRVADAARHAEVQEPRHEQSRALGAIGELPRRLVGIKYRRPRAGIRGDAQREVVHA